MLAPSAYARGLVSRSAGLYQSSATFRKGRPDFRAGKAPDHGPCRQQVMAASQRVIHPRQQVYGGKITGTWEVDTGQQARAEGFPGHWHWQPNFGSKYTRPQTCYRRQTLRAMVLGGKLSGPQALGSKCSRQG